MSVADLSNMATKAAETHADAVRRVGAAAQDLIRRAGVAVAAQMLLDEEHERIRAGFAALEVTRRAIDLAAGGTP